MSNVVNGYSASRPTVQLDLDNMPQELTYNEDNILETATVVLNGVSYTQTATIEGTLITGVSIWEADDLSLRRNTLRARRVLAEHKKNELR